MTIVRCLVPTEKPIGCVGCSALSDERLAELLKPLVTPSSAPLNAFNAFNAQPQTALHPGDPIEPEEFEEGIL